MLLALFVPIIAVMSLHHHESSGTAVCHECEILHHHVHSNHLAVENPWSQCLICHFNISKAEKPTFTEVAFFNDDFSAAPSVPQTAFTERTAQRCISLRAPPAYLFL